MITIIDYKSGNIASVRNALDKLGYNSELTNDPAKIQRAEKIIFPGVGRAGACMKELNQLGLAEVIRNLKVPFLGICLGMQLLSEYSEEDETQCVGVFSGAVKKFPDSVKVPQIGWNKVEIIEESPLLSGIENNSYFYFVNSYSLPVSEKFTLAESLYGSYFSAIVNDKNFYGTQFHPEKSGEVGFKLLSNFCELC